MTVVIVIALVLLAIVGAPLFCVLGAAGLVLFARDGSIVSVAGGVFGQPLTSSPMWVTLPLLALTGHLLGESGAPKRLLRVSRALLGWLPGGFAVFCLCIAAFFTTLSGGGSITMVALGGVLFPALIEEKYPDTYSLGVVTAGGSLGRLFPPSITIGAYAVVAGILIEKLSLAGVVPGGLVMMLVIAHAIVMHWKRRAPGPEAWTSFKQLLRWCAAFFAASLLFTTTLFTLAFLVPAAQPWLAGHARALALPGFLFAFVAAVFATSGEARAALKGAFWELILPFLVGGVVLAGGLTMAYEAAAFAALYVLVIEVFVYRDIQLRRDIPNVVKKSAILFGVIVALLATGTGFTAFLVQAEVPGTVVTWIDGLVTSPGAFLLLLDVFLVIVGMIVDPFTAIIVLVPLIGPIGRHYGIDECHLGIVVVLSLEIGALMPPLGLNTLISALRFERPLAKVYWALAPFLALLLIALMLVTYVPGLSTALASLVPAPPIRPPDEAPAEPIPPPPDDIFGEDDFDFEEQP